jgi:hypothetical protein
MLVVVVVLHLLHQIHQEMVAQAVVVMRFTVKVQLLVHQALPILVAVAAAVVVAVVQVALVSSFSN